MSAAAGGNPASAGGNGALRLFFALVPDAQARRSLAQRAGDIAQETGGRATRAANLHLTLAFLGRVPQARAADVEAIGAQAAATAEPFALVLDRVGLFRDAGAAWIGTDDVAPALRQIAGALRDALRAARLPVERRAFHPHVTLARHAVRSPTADAASPGVRWRVDAIALMASHTLPAGALYRVLASWPLAGRERAQAPR
jgi:2'-5' RNA ligase